MRRSRIIHCAVAGGLMLGLSACTNPYDPVQRFVGGGLIGEWGCNRGSRCRRPRCGARRRGRRSCRGGDRPYHNPTPACLS